MIKYFCFVVLLGVATCFAGNEGEKLLRSLQKKFETINDLTVDIVQKSGEKEILSGKLSYKKENKFYLDLKSNFIVSNGFAIWNYSKKRNKVIINQIDKADPSFFSFDKIIYDYPSECTVTLEKEGDSNVMIFIPNESSNLGFNKAKLWVGKDYLISKVMLNGLGSENVEVVFSNYKLNQDLPDSKFIFDPPEGSVVIDLR
jgi:outer membrane lipoprotein-sorting protein